MIETRQDEFDGRSRRGFGASVLGVALLSAFCAAAYAVDWDSPVRTAVSVAFLLVAPGLAIAELLQVDDGLVRLALVPGISVAVGTLVSICLAYAGGFSSTAALAILEGLAVAAVIAAVWRRVSSA